MNEKYIEVLIFIAEVYSELCQTTKMKRFTKIVINYESLTIFAKCSILDVWQGSEYASVIQF